jgi:alpha-ribazole phosphatase
MTRFWLVRHGEPVEEVRNRCYGSLDARLSENGRAQMRQVAEGLRSEHLAEIYASPHCRALESAHIIGAAACCAIRIVADFREIDFGDFEGLSYDQIAALYPELYARWMETPTEVRFPNGETFSEMRIRVLNAFHSIHREREDQTVGIVSHGGVNRIVLGWALQMPDECLFRLAQDYGAINLLSFVDNVPSVQLVNYRCSDRE